MHTKLIPIQIVDDIKGAKAYTNRIPIALGACERVPQRPVNGDRPERAGIRTGIAPDAPIRIDASGTGFGIVGNSTHRANLLAGRFDALHADHWE